MFPPPHLSSSGPLLPLDAEAYKIDALARKIQEPINTLGEYCTALISAAVKGKIDVRGETT